MAKFGINESGIEGLNKLSEDLGNTLEEIQELTQALGIVVSNCSGSIGEHEDDIQDLVDEIQSTSNSAQEPVSQSADAIKKLAENYLNILNKKYYGNNTSNGGIKEGISSGTGGGNSSPKAMSPKEALTKYIYDHNYGSGDYPTYSKDPEWQYLNHNAFPDTLFSNREFTYDEKVAWASEFSSNPESFVNSIVSYAGNGYSRVHWDTDGSEPETNPILEMFDSHKIAPYQGTIYRGLKFNSRKDVIKALKRKNGIWTEPGITSFTCDSNIGDNFAGKGETGSYGIVFICKNNKSALPVNHLSPLEYEKEILSPGNHRGAKWKIDYKSAKWSGNIIYVNIEEL